MCFFITKQFTIYAFGSIPFSICGKSKFQITNNKSQINQRIQIQNYALCLLLIYLSIPAAAFLPSPIAKITVAPPLTMSPPAKISLMED